MLPMPPGARPPGSRPRTWPGRTGPGRRGPLPARRLHRHTQLTLDGDHDPALGGAVELRQDDAGHVHDLGEHARLAQSVLPGDRVQDEQHLPHRARFSITRLTLPSSSIRPVLVCSGGRVDDRTTSTPRSAPSRTASKATLAGSARHGRPGRSGRRPVRPGLQLVGGGRAERVGGPEQHGLAVTHQDPGQLPDGGGLARAVHTDHQHHPRGALVALQVQRAIHVLADLGDQLGPQQGATSSTPWTRRTFTSSAGHRRSAGQHHATSAVMRTSSISSQVSSSSRSRDSSQQH